MPCGSDALNRRRVNSTGSAQNATPQQIRVASSCTRFGFGSVRLAQPVDSDRENSEENQNRPREVRHRFGFRPRRPLR